MRLKKHEVVLLQGDSITDAGRSRTNDEDLGHDATELFNYLTTGYLPKRKYHKLLPAPKHLKPAILDKIAREVAGHSAKSPGLIQFKTNALEDADVTRALYEASRAGVKVDLIVRDTCRIRPGIENLSHNVRVVGIVGRFLEHSRIYYFRNGGDDEVLLGSADLMPRNLDGRVETLFPIEDEEIRRAVGDDILFVHLGDTHCARRLLSDGSYESSGSRLDHESVENAVPAADASSGPDIAAIIAAAESRPTDSEYQD